MPAISLRARSATSAALGDAPEWAIMKQTGHRSRAMLDRYFRPAGRFRNIQSLTPVYDPCPVGAVGRLV